MKEKQDIRINTYWANNQLWISAHDVYNLIALCDTNGLRIQIKKLIKQGNINEKLR